MSEKNYVGAWSEDLQNMRGRTILAALDIRGERDKHLGPRFEKAAVNFRFEPSERLEVTVGSNLMGEEQFVDSAVYGVLDVLMVALPLPVNSLRISVLSIEVDPIDSSSMAFRNAGRDAASKLLATL